MAATTRGEIVRGTYEDNTPGVIRLGTLPVKVLPTTTSRKKKIYQEGSVVVNFSGSTALFSAFIVPTGGVVGDTTVVMNDVALLSNETLSMPGLIIQGESELWMSASADEAINVYPSYGVEWSR